MNSEKATHCVENSSENSDVENVKQLVSAWPETIVASIFCVPLFAVIALFADMSFYYSVDTLFIIILPLCSCIVFTYLADEIRKQPLRAIVLSICLIACALAARSMFGGSIAIAVVMVFIFVVLASLVEVIAGSFYDRKVKTSIAVGCFKSAFTAITVNIIYFMLRANSSFVHGFHLAAMAFVSHMLVWNKVDNIRFIGEQKVGKKKQKPWFIRMLKRIGLRP